MAHSEVINNDPFITRSSHHQTRNSIFTDNHENSHVGPVMGVSHQRLHNDNLKEEILKDQIERLEHENTERSRLLGKIDQVMMRCLRPLYGLHHKIERRKHPIENC
jgi:hypothetical protein